MSNTVVVTAAALALGVLASAALAEAAELTDAEMDKITAGAFQAFANNLNTISDARPNGTYFVYNRNANNNYVDNENNVWTPLVLYYFANNVAVGVLYNPVTGQYWDGGYRAFGSGAPLAKYGVGLL